MVDNRYFPVVTPEEIVADNDDMISSLLATAKQANDDYIRELNHISETNSLTTLTPWHRRTVWHETFINQDMAKLHGLAAKPTATNSKIHAWNYTLAMIEECFESVKDLHKRNWHLIPFWLASADMNQSESVPFRRYFKSDVVHKYAQVWQQYICFCLTALNDSSNHGVQFTQNQRSALIKLSQLIDNFDPLEDSATASKELQKQIHEVSVALIKHKDWEPQRSSLIYFAGVLGFHLHDHRWKLAHEYTPTLAALQFCIRVIMLEHSLPMDTRDDDYQFRREDPLTVFRRTRDYWLVEGMPTPFNYLHKLLNYGWKVGKDGRGRTLCRWSRNGKTLFFGGKQIHMRAWKKMSHDVMDELEEFMSEKLLFRGDKSLPQMDLNEIIDDPGRVDTPHYFARDGFSNAQRQMLEAFVKSNNHGVRQNGDNSGFEFDPNQVKMYLKRDREFRELLYIAYIWTCGLAGRTQENASLKYYNTMNGERNMCIEDGQFMCVSSYHKSQAITDTLKVLRCVTNYG